MKNANKINKKTESDNYPLIIVN